MLVTTSGLSSREDRDCHRDTRNHGGPDRMVSLYSIELIREARELGYALGPGSRGENVTTEGLDLAKLRPGDVLGLGSHALIQLTAPSYPCSALRRLCRSVVAWKRLVEWMGHEPQPLAELRCGWYARVLSNGYVQAGDQITDSLLTPESLSE